MSSFSNKLHGALINPLYKGILEFRRRGGFNPASLFRNGEVGVYYDPSDMSTLFQDSAGTTPVTAAGQPVGLMLDKSKGLELGPELVTNGDFSNGTTGWAPYSGYPAPAIPLTVVGGALNWGGDGAARYLAGQEFPGSLGTYVVGRWYFVEFTLTVLTGIGPSLAHNIGNYNVNCLLVNTLGGSAQSPGTYKIKGALQALASGQAMFNFEYPAGRTGTFKVDNISVKLLAGNHAYQPTAGKRPILMQSPAGGVRNLLTYTEDFTNAAWIKNANGTGVPAVVTSGFTDPDGGASAWRFQLNAGAGVTGGDISRVERPVPNGSGTGTSSWWIKSNTGISQSIEINSGPTTSVKTITTSWQRFDVTGTNMTGMGVFIRGNFASSADILVWHPQSEPGPTATPYQKVTNQYTVTEEGVPSVWSLKFDGIDDFMSTAAIDFSGTDKVSTWAGFGRIAVSGLNILVELGSGTGASGTLRQSAPENATSELYFGMKGATTAAGYKVNNLPVGAVPPAFTTCLYDLSAVTTAAQVVPTMNGASLTLTPAEAGPADGTAFGNYPLYIASRAGTSMFFNGNLYPTIIAGALYDANTVTKINKYVAKKTGVTL